MALPAFSRRTPLLQRSIGFSVNLQQRRVGTDRQTERQTDTVPLLKPCSAYYAGNANKMRLVNITERGQQNSYAIEFAIGNESVPIQLAQCWFSGLAISQTKNINILFQIKYTEAILSNSTRKLLWFEISKMTIAVLKINLLCYLLKCSAHFRSQLIVRLWLHLNDIMLYSAQ